MMHIIRRIAGTALATVFAVYFMLALTDLAQTSTPDQAVTFTIARDREIVSSWNELIFSFLFIVWFFGNVVYGIRLAFAGTPLRPAAISLLAVYAGILYISLNETGATIASQASGYDPMASMPNPFLLFFFLLPPLVSLADLFLPPWPSWKFGKSLAEA